MKKRFFSLLVAICMVVTMVPSAVFAVEEGAGEAVVDSGVKLDNTEYVIDEATVGYAEAPTVTVTVENIGKYATGELTVALSGDGDKSFTVPATIASIEKDSTGKFTVTANKELAAGEYAATVTVTGSGTPATATVSFKVSAKAEALTGTVTITGDLKFGGTLTAKLTEGNTTEASTLSYQWKRGETAITDATSASYTIVEENDIGTVLTCEVTSDAPAGSKTGTTTDVVGKADGPKAPNVSFSFDGESANKLVGATTAMQYSLDGGSNYAECTADMPLVAADIKAAYGIKIHVKETVTHLPGAVLFINITEAEKPTVTVNENADTITGVTTAMEYKLRGATDYIAITGTTVTGLAAGAYLVRVKATGTVQASPDATVVIGTPTVEQKTPTKDDLTFDLTTKVNYDGREKPLTVTAVAGKDLGAITVKYGTETTAPTNAGTYVITVDTAGSETYNAATGLSLGNYTISKIAATTLTKTVATSVEAAGKVAATVKLPAIPAGASYGTLAASGDIAMTAMSISGTTLTYTAPASTAGQTGTITIPVTGATNYNDYSIVVTITSTTKPPQTISFANPTVDKTYGAVNFTNALTQTTGDGAITYASDDAAVATVDSKGAVTIVGAGTTTITATVAATDTHAAAPQPTH